MVSRTRWTWVWVNSGRWWWTGRPGVLRFMGSQRVGHDWATELNWTELIPPHNILCEGCCFLTQDVSLWGTSGALLQVLSSATFFILAVLGFRYGTQAFLVVCLWAQLPHGMWDLCLPTRDRTCIPCIGRQILNHGATRNVSQIQLLFQARKLRLVLHGPQFDWSRHCLTGSQFTHVVCDSTPGFLSPWRNHLTFTCVLPRNLGKAYASWGNSWITRGLKQAHHLFFLSPALALHCLRDGFQRGPWSGNHCLFDCWFENTSLFTLSCSSCLYPWLHTLRSYCRMCDQTVSLTFFLEQFKLRCL